MGKRKTRYVVDEVAIGNVTDVAAMDVKKSKRDSIAPGIVHVPMSSDDDEVGAHPKVMNKDQVDEKGGKRLSKSKEYARERNGAEKAQLWFRRCSRILRNCADEGLSKLIASSLVTWPMKDVHRVCSEWTPIVLSTVLTPDTCEPAWLAMLLGHYHRRYVAECCESWSVEDLQLIIPRLAVDMILYVLKRLYFECSDKYLSAKECQRLLMKIPERKRVVLYQHLDEDAVEHVLRKQQDGADSDDDEEEEEEEEEEEFESSFVDDGEEGEYDEDYEDEGE